MITLILIIEKLEKESISHVCTGMRWALKTIQLNSIQYEIECIYKYINKLLI